MKSKLQKGAIATVETVMTPVHLSVILTGNLVKATTDFVGDKLAKGEGHLIHAIDNSKSVEATAFQRNMATDMYLGKASKFLEKRNAEIQRYLDKSKSALKETVVDIEENLGLFSEVESLETKLMLVRKERDAVIAKISDPKFPSPDNEKELRTLNNKIGRLNKELAAAKAKSEESVLPTATPAQAFDLDTTQPITPTA